MVELDPTSVTLPYICRGGFRYPPFPDVVMVNGQTRLRLCQRLSKNRRKPPEPVEQTCLEIRDSELDQSITVL